jgi:cAMP-dependent protein kinase regulator
MNPADIEEDPHTIYVNQRLNPILDEMVAAILSEEPEDIEDFIIEWVKIRKGELPPRPAKAIVNPISKREKREPPPDPISKYQMSNPIAEDQMSEEDEDDYVDELPTTSKRTEGGRSTVMAEVYGEHNQKGDFTPNFIEKTPEQSDRIIDRLSRAFMFEALDDKERDIVVNAMEERHAEEGETVIRQGDDGNELFVLDSGSCNCEKVFKAGTNPVFLKTYAPGDAFGELALLYNAPRAATIIATEPCTFWVLDRECFNHIVKDSAAKKRERYDNFLAKVGLLETMDPYERSKLADAFQSVNFDEGDYIISEGDSGSNFYFLEEGEAVATKQIALGQEPVEVERYVAGDYFGELALLTDQPRAANIVAMTDVACVSIDRDAFSRLLGPLDEILRRNAKKYDEVMEKLKT